MMERTAELCLLYLDELPGTAYSVEKLPYRNYSKNSRPAEALRILGRGGLRATVARDQEPSSERSEDPSSELSIAMHPRKNLGSMQFGVFQQNRPITDIGQPE